jgi:hypothetical protein
MNKTIKARNKYWILLLVIGLGFALLSVRRDEHRLIPLNGNSSDMETNKAADEGKFRCAGKTSCREMVSCEEAKYYLRHCPDVQIDGDGDGIPCEDQLCGH